MPVSKHTYTHTHHRWVHRKTDDNNEQQLPKNRAKVSGPQFTGFHTGVVLFYEVLVLLQYTERCVLLSDHMYRCSNSLDFHS